MSEEWIRVEDEKPEETGWYNGSIDGRVFPAYYHKEIDRFEDRLHYPMKISYWKPLPKAPKE